MHRFLTIPIALLILAISQSSDAVSSTNPPHYKNQTLSQLETRLEQIDSELARLARFTPRSGAGSIGWSSKQWKIPDHPEWAEVKLSGNEEIDRIVLVPVLWNYADTGPQASGFPEAFEVIAGAEGDTEGKVIARFGPEDHLLPRVAPLVISIPPISPAWVRIRSPQLSISTMESRYAFCLSEIMLFSGDRNVARNQRVRVSSTTTSWGGDAVSARALTDGSTPFLMDASHGKKSRTYLARFPTRVSFRFIIDLENSCPVDEIRFHSASDVRQHIPLPKQVEYGLPRHLVVEGANTADFSEAVTLLDYHRSSIYDAGPILVRSVPGTRCRYIRLSVPDPYLVPPKKETCYVNFSELEVISQGRNVALGKTVAFPPKGIWHQSKESITDGSNNFGVLLPIRDWMEQLARRHDLERERPLLLAELNARYARQKKNLLIMYWTAGALAVTAVLIILIDRILRMRHVARLKHRFSADLHDELGANLHAIGLLGDMAKRKLNDPDTLTGILDRIRQLTERSGNATRHCTDLLESQDLCNDLIDEMKRSSNRLLADAEHEIRFEGEPFIHQLAPRKRIDLFLFYKECLTNIVRHSQATRITTRLTGSPKEIRLIITDNGQGVSSIPHSLKRRARFLRAQIHIENPTTGGTEVTLRLINHRWLHYQKPEPPNR